MRRPTFGGFAAFTTALTALLVALGVYTAATGSGLACSQQWPLCDGGLLPQSLPSFIEWFHRLVAMITGFFIAGTAAWSWRVGDRHSRLAATGALALLPLQISIGAVTVTLGGAIPGGYSPPTHAAHLLVALTIFALLVLTTLSAFDGPDPERRARLALLAATPTLLANAAVSRATPLVPYDPAVQAAFVATALVAFAALLAAVVSLGATVVSLGATDLSRARTLTGLALGTHFVAVLLGRDLVAFTDAALAANRLLVLVALAATLAATRMVTRATGSGRSTSTLSR